MILTCPACNTRYLVPDAAIGTTGRRVRCAACRHSWFQDAPVLDLGPAPAAPAESGEAPSDAPAGSPAPESGAAPASAPETVEEAAGPGPIPSSVEPRPVYGEDDIPPAAPVPAYDAFAHEAPFRPRRNPARLWTLLAVIAAAVMLAAVAALAYFGPPAITARLGLASEAKVPLIIEATRPPERRTIPSGNELFSVTGRIINPTGQTQPVPDIHANLLDAQDRIVYAWTIARPVASLPPGGTVSFSGATLDVPKNARNLDLSLAAKP